MAIEMNNEHKSILMQIIIGIAIAGCSASIGFGISQMGIISQVSKHSILIERIDKRIDEDRMQWREELRAEEKRTDGRIFSLAGLVQEVIKSNAEQAKATFELVSLIKLQNIQRNP